MAEIRGGGNGGDNADSSDRLKLGETEAERARIDNQPTTGASSSVSAGIPGSEGGGNGHAEEISGDGERRAPVELGRTPVELGCTPVELGPVGPRVDQMDPRSGVEGSVVTGLGSVGAGASGNGGSGGDDGSGQPPRDPASGKAPMVKDESTPVERSDHIEQVEFMPPIGSSSHKPTMSSDLAEFVGLDRLAQLLKEAPKVVAAVVTAREERLAEIARWNEQERLIREQETAAREQGEFERETEAAEREQEEAVWVTEHAVAQAKTLSGNARATFTPETYVPPVAHLFVPFGMDIYVPLQDSYDNELVLRDPRHHVSVGWEQVLIEWAREAACLMLAMEKAFHRIASGTPLQLHYPPAAPAPTVQPQRGGDLLTRQGSSRAGGARRAEEAARGARTEESEEGEEGDEQFSLSSGSNSASDPRFRFNPGDLAAAEVSEEDSDSDGIDPEDFDD
ncbi:hypothetical protein RHMOL_Rhmol08G0201200 [Rhododendron molle]|uniref:Uncharacterized protein n=1 Tax=Rhododendron molle TaxID=49168 RepID=A0ACC0MRQ1_RHOML|nr:hypothetical protein RHMOL_Rhmol08G0201200 [Rhododendron molle]